MYTEKKTRLLYFKVELYELLDYDEIRNWEQNPDVFREIIFVDNYGVSFALLYDNLTVIN